MFKRRRCRGAVSPPVRNSRSAPRACGPASWAGFPLMFVEEVGISRFARHDKTREEQSQGPAPPVKQSGRSEANPFGAAQGCHPRSDRAMARQSCSRAIEVRLFSQQIMRSKIKVRIKSKVKIKSQSQESKSKVKVKIKSQSQKSKSKSKAKSKAADKSVRGTQPRYTSPTNSRWSSRTTCSGSTIRCASLWLRSCGNSARRPYPRSR